jgi:Tfp pilus assembly protein PilF
LLYLNNTEYQKAIEDFNSAVEIDPDDPDVYFNRAYAKEYNSDFEGAINDYSTAISFDSTDSKLFVNRGTV